MTDTADQEAGVKFEPLAAVLAPYFGKRIEQIPEDLQRRIQQLVVAPVWDTLSEDQQCMAATQWDWEYDPSKENARRKLWELQTLIDEEAMKATPTMLDVVAQEKRRAQ